MFYLATVLLKYQLCVESWLFCWMLWHCINSFVVFILVTDWRDWSRCSKCSRGFAWDAKVSDGSHSNSRSASILILGDYRRIKQAPKWKQWCKWNCHILLSQYTISHALLWQFIGYHYQMKSFFFVDTVLFDALQDYHLNKRCKFLKVYIFFLPSLFPVLCELSSSKDSICSTFLKLLLLSFLSCSSFLLHGIFPNMLFASWSWSSSWTFFL